MKYKTRRTIAIAASAVAISSWVYFNSKSYETVLTQDPLAPLGVTTEDAPLAADVLEQLPVKGRASKSGYARTEFYSSWPSIDGCSLRQRIIRREMDSSAVVSTEDNCTVISGEYDEPYTGSHLIFYQKSDFSSGVQIDHVVALSDAWQKGAQSLTKEQRYALRITLAAYGMFVIGVLASYFIVFPMMVHFFGSYQVSTEVPNLISIESYMDSLMSTTLIMGLVFELPVMCWMLGRFGLISAAWMRRYRRHALVGIMIVAAIITPPDVVSMCLVVVPIYMLYELSIRIVRN